MEISGKMEIFDYKLQDFELGDLIQIYDDNGLLVDTLPIYKIYGKDKKFSIDIGSPPNSLVILVPDQDGFYYVEGWDVTQPKHYLLNISENT